MSKSKTEILVRFLILLIVLSVFAIVSKSILISFDEVIAVSITLTVIDTIGYTINKLKGGKQMEKKEFILYFDKKGLELTIKPNKNKLSGKFTDEVVQYNNCYFTCTSREKLREKAKELREEWLEEARDKLKALEELKVINKY